MYKYELKRMRDTSQLRYGGYRIYRNFELRIDGKLFRKYRDDDPETDYDQDRALDKRIMKDIKHLRKFFKGTLIKTSVKNTREKRKDKR